jgi:hypothetical protein
MNPESDKSTKPFQELCRSLYETWEKYEKQKQIATDIFHAYEELEAEVLQKMEDDGLEKFHVPGCGTVGIMNKFTVSLPKEPGKREAFFEFLKQKKVFNDLITVNHNTLNSFYKAEMNAAIEQGAVDFQVPGLDEPKHSKSLVLRSK